jgi:hypothetical protein
VILDLSLLSLAVAIEPIPITFLVLLLAAEHGTSKGLSFLAGWVTCLVAVLAAALLVTGGKPIVESSGSSLLGNSLKLAAGVVLLVIGVITHQRRHRPRSQPRYMARIDSLRGWQIAAFAAFLSPQAVVFAAGATVLDMKVGNFAEYLVLVGFVLVGSAPYLGLLVYTAFWPSHSEARLARLRAWLEVHRNQVLVAVCLLIGAWLVGRTLLELAFR